MYHPQCEHLMPHESLDMGVGQSHLAASAVAANPAELKFHHLLSYVDTGAVSAQPAVEYLFGGTDHQPHAQLEQLATNHQAMAMLRDYYGQYPAEETYLGGGGGGGPRTAGSSSLVLGAGDDESAYMAGRFELDECSPKPRSMKRSRGGTGGFHGPGVEKKEKQRRQRLSDKFTALMLLVPSRTKEDRATVIFDAIEYIKELGRTVEELTLLVEKKRRRREQSHQLGDVVDAAAAAVAESSVQPIRSTFIQRKSKETLVDVRIVEDEVNIKLTKRRRDGCGCLAAAARALDDLCLELVHLSGGKIGNCHIYMFNTKIHQGSPVFASAVASKLIQVVDDEY